MLNADDVTDPVPPGVLRSAGPLTRPDRTRTLLIEPSYLLYRVFVPRTKTGQGSTLRKLTPVSGALFHCIRLRFAACRCWMGMSSRVSASHALPIQGIHLGA